MTAVTWFEKLERMVVSMTWSRSASAKTRAGFLPPSSSESFLQKGALSSVMSRAVAVEPVKEMRGTSGWLTRALPALGPVPNTMLTTPGGTPTHTDTGSRRFGAQLDYCWMMGDDPGLPACCMSLHSIQAVTEVISLGLATTVFPAAMAGAIFQVSR